MNKRSHLLDGFTYLEQKVIVLGIAGSAVGVTLLRLVELVS